MTIDDLRELLASATPQPWFARIDPDYEAWIESDSGLASGPVEVTPFPHNNEGEGIKDADAVLVVALRNQAEALVEIAEAVQEWSVARSRLGTCRDEFGWGHEGDEPCAAHQEAEDSAAEALVDALKRLEGQ